MTCVCLCDICVSVVFTAEPLRTLRSAEMLNMNYPFADIDLARRLERTEARSNADFVEARARAFPDRGATWIEVAGAYAMFDGVGSPLTQTFGLGVFEPITGTHMDALEEFFRSRGADVFHEVCPIADNCVFTFFNKRGYQPVEFSNVAVSTDKH